MESVLELDETIQIERQEDEHGDITYVLPNGVMYDSCGTIIKTKIESCVEGSSTTQTTEQLGIHNKELNKQKKTTKSQKKMSGNTQFFEGVHEYTEGLVNILLEKFEGKVMGGDDMTLELMMKELFGDYKPGDKVKKAKKAKKDSGTPKPKRALSGYTFFGQANKETFNSEIASLDPKPNYISYQSAKWKELAKEEKDEWGVKAKAHHEASVKDKE